MKYLIKGACKSVTGNIRGKNEDNYYFNFKTLKEENEDTKVKTMQFEKIKIRMKNLDDIWDGEASKHTIESFDILKEYEKKRLETIRKYIEIYRKWEICI